MAMKVIDGVRYRPEDVERFSPVLGKSVRTPRNKAATVKPTRRVTPAGRSAAKPKD